METRLDWSTQLEQGEWEGIKEQYDRLMGPGQVEELFRFVPFMHDVRPDALKRYRLFVNTVTQGIGLEDSMPNPPVASLVSGHFYATLPYPQGVAGDLFVAKHVGGTKQEVSDILAMAFLHSGPFGMNTSSAAAAEYLRTWDDSDAPGLTWPEGWTVDPEAFRCGIDFEGAGGADELSADDLAKIEAWHVRVQGEVPAYVPFLAKHYPLALKTFRARYETSMTGTLPKQFIALSQVHLAACWVRPDALRRALHMARAFGVSKDHAVQILTLSMLYLGDIRMDAAIEGVDGILEAWERGNQAAR
jgi:hypothetical protein